MFYQNPDFSVLQPEYPPWEVQELDRPDFPPQEPEWPQSEPQEPEWPQCEPPKSETGQVVLAGVSGLIQPAPGKRGRITLWPLVGSGGRGWDWDRLLETATEHLFHQGQHHPGV
jgi:hypothetical protein